MSNLNIGIVGIGNMGSAHAKSILSGSIKDLTLIAICDNDNDKIEWAKKNIPGVKVYSEYKEMIDSGEIDAVLIATPHYLHPTIGVYAFEKKLHVLSEKPIGVFTKAIRELNAAAERSGKVFGIMYNQRTNPMYAKAREMVKSGALGELKRFVWIVTNWYRSQSYYDSGTWRATWAGEGGGVLINQCPHNLDLWQWIFGMPIKVTGFCTEGKYHNIEVEDDITAYAEYANGSTAVFISTTGECPGTNRLEISGDKGKLIIEDGKMKFWQLSVPEREFCFTTKEGFAVPDMEVKEIQPSEKETGHNGILQNFTNAVLYGEKMLAPGYEGVNGLTISNAIHLSSWTNTTQTLPLDEDLYYNFLKEKISGSKKKTEVKSEISDLQGTFNSRWEVKW